MTRTFVALTFGVFLVACARPNASVAPDRVLGWDEVIRLYHARDYFALRDRLASSDTAGSLPARYARALVEHAFNAPAASNATITSLLTDPRLPRGLAVALRKVEVANDLRLFAYRAGLTTADSLLRDTTGIGAADLRDLRNTRELFRALAAVPPQVLSLRGPATLQLAEGRVPVQIDDSTRHYVFDTGANLSTIMRSEAVALGLRFHPSGLDIGTATDKRVAADLAVADRLALGGAEFRNVVFLVLDDSLLTFPGGFRIPGIIGFPVISQLSEVRFARDRIVIPAAPPTRHGRNLALDELTPLTPVGWQGMGERGELLCRLDTGADRTQFYEPFYRRYRARIDASTPRRTRRSGGAGGIRALPTRLLPRIQLDVGDTVVRLDSSDVLTVSITRDTSANFLDCNIGHDVLDQFPLTIINFRDMAFLLRSSS
jgi:hypothetical protein